MVFSLSIALGNEGMQTAGDVSRMLGALSAHLAEGWDFSSKTLPGTIWPLRDENGNRVGSWTITADEPEGD